ncbi:hypothetical protein VTN00DRAFT_5752 [Thermoascus crustaceus]|uniref:uncharacterized protein n=1 Tax=Thermoascus crustaceus TaxID=5088 RepID=UPI0037441380
MSLHALGSSRAGYSKEKRKGTIKYLYGSTFLLSSPKYLVVVYSQKSCVPLENKKINRNQLIELTVWESAHRTRV